MNELPLPCCNLCILTFSLWFFRPLGICTTDIYCNCTCLHSVLIFCLQIFCMKYILIVKMLLSLILAEAGECAGNLSSLQICFFLGHFYCDSNCKLVFALLIFILIVHTCVLCWYFACRCLWFSLQTCIFCTFDIYLFELYVCIDMLLADILYRILIVKCFEVWSWPEVE